MQTRERRRAAAGGIKWEAAGAACNALWLLVYGGSSLASLHRQYTLAGWGRIVGRSVTSHLLLPFAALVVWALPQASAIRRWRSRAGAKGLLFPAACYWGSWQVLTAIALIEGLPVRPVWRLPRIVCQLPVGLGALLLRCLAEPFAALRERRAPHPRMAVLSPFLWGSIGCWALGFVRVRLQRNIRDVSTGNALKRRAVAGGVLSWGACWLTAPPPVEALRILWAALSAPQRVWQARTERSRGEDTSMPPPEEITAGVAIWNLGISMALTALRFWRAKTAQVRARLRAEGEAVTRSTRAIQEAARNPHVAVFRDADFCARTHSFVDFPRAATLDLLPPGAISTATLDEKYMRLVQAVKLSRKEAGEYQGASTSFRLNNVQRDRILTNTLDILWKTPCSVLLAKHGEAGLYISFGEGETGIDLGGLRRDWMDSIGAVLTQEAQHSVPGALFVLGPDRALWPRPLGDTPIASPAWQRLFAVGRLLALALWWQIPLPVNMPNVLWKFILGCEVSAGDVSVTDPEFFRHRVARLLQKGGADLMAEELGARLTFVSAATERHPEPEELCPGGAELEVIEDNKEEYVKLLCEHFLIGHIRREIKVILVGFWSLLPADVLQNEALGLTPQDLSLFVQGRSDLDSKDWKKHAQVPKSHPHVIRWFWEVVEEMDSVERGRLLQFTTGSSRLPPGGSFQNLEPKFNVVHAGEEHQLPTSHTCSNQLVLPPYRSKAQLKKLLHKALESGAGFGAI